ncbi:hypothetical protein Bhyg_04950 [Pseudolycoriella hygida]|uniref:Uncharacterized protein n=1 Tax=Pseudolycoriella hygida TaxID=35572 RepID=A0A9Q0NHI0_9DIPT|nr:hypothetical protein Bhyg_04950 [Pseudolycoriella hygida]
MANKVDLQRSLQRYDEALATKSDRLPELDKWYRNELRSAVQSRKSDEDGAYLTTAELEKLVKWKLTRGKFRPRLEKLAGSNPDEIVKNTTKEAFSLLIESTSLAKVKESLLKLNTLKGIGPATSSAILSLFSPDSLPFMSDEALKFGAGLNEKPKYTVSEWEWFIGKMRNRVEKEGWNGTDELEKAAWSFGTLKPSITSTTEKRPATSENSSQSKRKRT